MTYIVSPYQTWGVLPNTMPIDQLWKLIDTSEVMFDDFQRDWIREDENSPTYEHSLLGEVSPNNIYINRFILDSDEV